MALASRRLWALTGTPVERDAEDLAVLMSLVDPRRFSSEDRELHLSALRARARPYLLRRRKRDVLRDLPAVVEREEELELTKRQLEAYRSTIAANKRPQLPNLALKLFGQLRAICDLEPTSGESSKLDRIEELLEEVVELGEKAVVFSYLLAPLRELTKRLGLAGNTGYILLTGDMGLGDRERAVTQFKQDPECSVLLASSRVGAEGLTLVEANHVFFLNQWWNPSANTQARDRVVRIGQTRTVWVWTFVCRGTVESRLREILREKEKTFEELVENIRRGGFSGEIQDLLAEPNSR